MLRVPSHAAWSSEHAVATVAPQLLLAPHPATSPIRCYEARTHESGLRVTIGVFETPDGVESQELIARMLMDPALALSPDASAQLVTLGTMSGVARTGWIRAAQASTAPANITAANINWYFAEPGTKRVHFVSTFVDVARGQVASDLVSALLRGGTFAPDDGRSLQAHILAEQ
jgi:hypothetical protein